MTDKKMSCFGTIIRAFPNYNWDFGEISETQQFSYEFIRDRINEPWSLGKLASNQRMPVKTLIKLIKIFPTVEGQICTVISRRWDFDPQYILDNLHLKWNWYEISASVDIDFIFAHPELPWVWICVSRNPWLTSDHIISNINKDWSPASLQKNYCINKYDAGVRVKKREREQKQKEQEDQYQKDQKQKNKETIVERKIRTLQWIVFILAVICAFQITHAFRPFWI